MNNTNTSSNEDLVNVSGQIIKINPEIHIKKYDNVLQKIVDKRYRTIVLANQTGAIIVMLWENMSNIVRLKKYLFLII